MSTQAFPTLPGKSWPITRTAIWQTRSQQSVSGKKLNIADWSYPMWRWGLTFNFVRGYNATLFAAEIAAIQGFFNSRYGSQDSFLYQDPNDYSVTGSTIGTGDSTDRTFQLSRTLGGFSEPIFAPSTVSAVYVSSAVLTSTQWSVANWGSTAPGVITIATALATSTQKIIADFTWSWPVSFDDDQMSFEEFVKQIWSIKSVNFTSLK